MYNCRLLNSECKFDNYSDICNTCESMFWREREPKLTKELLLNNGWEKYNDPVLAIMTDEDKNQLAKGGVNCDYEEYTFIALNKKHNPGKYWHLMMRYNVSNTPNRDWTCHIDSCAHSTVACADIGTITQFNKFMDLMDIEYRLC